MLCPLQTLLQRSKRSLLSTTTPFFILFHVAYRPFQVPIRLHDKIKETRDPVVGLDFVKVNKLKFGPFLSF